MCRRRDRSGSVEDPARERRARWLTLRAMRERDLVAVLAIERASFATPWSEQTFRSLMGRQDALLMVAEGQLSPRGRSAQLVVLGYAALWFAGEEAELGDLAVHPDARRRGVGWKLLEASLEVAVRRGATAVFLEVRASNRAARQLYEAAGFERVGVRSGYYRRPREDALVMRRPLGRQRTERPPAEALPAR